MKDNNSTIQPKRAASNRVLHQDLRSIYEEDGQLPNLSKLDPRARRTLWRMFWNAALIIIMVTSVAWLGFSLLGPGATGQGAVVSIDIPSEASVLSPTTMHIRYENKDRKPLALAILKVRYPKEFVPSHANPASDNETMTSWTLGTINRGGGGEIQIEGMWRGDVNTTPHVQATLTYKPADFNAEFTRVASQTITLKQSPLELGIDALDSVVAGAQLPVTIRYKNTSNETLSSLTLAVTVPGSFSIARTEPAPKTQGQWVIPSLEAGAEGTIALTGSFASDAASDAALKVEARTTSRRDTILLASSEHIVSVIKGNIVAHLRVGEDGIPAHLGSALPVAVDIENQGDQEVGDLEVHITSDSPLLDWNKVSAQGARVSRGEIVWMPSGLDALKHLAPKGMATLRMTIAIIPDASPKVSSDLEWNASVRIRRMADKKIDTIIKSSAATVPVGTNFRVESYGRYYDDAGTTLGSGPIPPRVGSETKYRITWVLKNSYHDINALVLEAPLGEGVSFISKASVGAGTLQWVPESRTVRWEVNRLPTAVSELEASFDIAATPRESDRGNPMLLQGELKGSAYDIITTQTLKSGSDLVSTYLPKDSRAASKGAVQ